MCDYVYKSKGRENDKCPYSEFGEIQIEDKKLCIFHAPIDERKNNLFWDLFKQALGSNFIIKRTVTTEYIDYEGFIFPGIQINKIDSIFLSNWTINLKFSEFTGILLLSGAENKNKPIKNKIWFNHAKFQESCIFKYVDFEEDMDFSNAIFVKAAIFNYSSFLKKCSFMYETKFNGPASFIETVFNNVNFMGACFYSSVNFDDAEFSKDNSIGKFNTDFINVKFLSRQHDVYFSNAEFYSKVRFTGLETQSATVFFETEFNDDVDFSNALFGNSVRFEKAIFGGQANFYNGPIFQNDAHFENALFKKRADFTGAKFLGTTYFKWATFEQDVHFPDVKFEDVYFISSVFKSLVVIKDADFGILDFKGSVFQVRPFMGGLGACSEIVLIENLLGEVNMEFKRGCRTDGVEKPFKLIFSGGELDGVISIETQLNEIIFKNVTLKATTKINPPEMKPKALFCAYNADFLGNTIIRNTDVRYMMDCLIGKEFKIFRSNLDKAIFKDIDLSKIDFIDVVWTKIARKGILSYIFPYDCRFYYKIDGLYDEIIHGNKEQINEKYFIAPNLETIAKEEKKEIEEKYRGIASSYESHSRFGMAGHFKAGEFEIRKNYAPKREKIWLWAYRWASFYGESIWKPLAMIGLSALFPIIPYLCFGKICFQQALYHSLKGCFSFGSEIVGQSGEFLSFIPFIQKFLLLIFTPLFLFALRRKVKR